MNMLDVCKCIGGNASYALLRQRIRWDLNSSILLMALFIQTVLMVQSGYFAPNARTHTILLVSAPTNQNQQDGPLYAGFWNANSKQVKVDLPSKWVIFKRVILLVAVVKQKKGKPRPKQEERRGKDGRLIGIRQKACAGEGKKEQQWSEADLNKAFNLFEANKDKAPNESSPRGR